LKYFIPEWDDRVDPKYSFLADTHSQEHEEDPIRNDVYIWDVFGLDSVPVDGVLVSRMTIMQNKKKYERVLREGIHNTLRLPQNFEIMGDCGAFGYIEEDDPPFETSEVLDYYTKCGFNLGVSVDHLVVPAFEEQKEKRWKITIENAREMFDLWQSKDEYMKSLRVIGVSQGWDVDSYRKSVRELLEIGYDYIALGGLARSPTGEEEFGRSKTIYNVACAVWLEVKEWMKSTGKKADIHLLGIARPELMPHLLKYGISSFDSASFLRKAWLSAAKNYYTLSGKFYGAIRIPQVGKSPAVKGISNIDLNKLEKEALKATRSYDQGKISRDEALKAILEYDEVIGKGRGLEKYYRETLTDTPWKKCPCAICKDVGVEAIIFRGNNRNRRRGFHNTFVFYKKLREASPRIFVFTTCTARKNETPRLIPAYERYVASPGFKAFWNHVFDLPIEIGVLSAKFGLIDWFTRIPYYDYRMEESDVPRFVEELKEKLREYDKIFFIGLGLYREVVRNVKEETGLDIEIFPKKELTERGKLDIIEYTKQMKFFRRAIIQAIPEKSRSPEKKQKADSQLRLEKFS